MIGAGSLRFPIYTSFPKTLAETSRPQHHLATAMKDRPPPSSYGAVYVPPHHRLRSVITTSSNNLSSSAISVSDSNSKSVATQQNKSSSNLRPNPYPYLPPHQQQKRNSQSDWADELSEEGSDRDIEPSSYPGASTTDNLDGWKWKLTTLLRSKDKQELVSRDKKDRRDFEQIAALASKVGLYSHLYVKVVVVSKVPLPNYRFDLDDKRPQREVILPPGLQRRVDCHLGDHLSRKSGSVESFRDNAFSRSSSSCSIATDEGLFEQPEPLPESKAAMEKVIWRRSMQLRSQQQTWQD